MDLGIGPRAFMLVAEPGTRLTFRGLGHEAFLKIVVWGKFQ